MIKLRKYNSLIFDCDGVILNSNKIKTNAFRKVLKQYNQKAVNEFIKYHLSNGGVSRYAKFEFFINNILSKFEEIEFNKKILLKELLNNYSKQSKSALFKCEVTKKLKILRNHTEKIPWFIVSGGDQKELIEVFKHKQIYDLFNGGIFGSPDKKNEIIKREIINGNIKFPALMFGDSKLDYVVAKSNKIDFLFVTKWTDFLEYKAYCFENNISTVEYVSDILKIEDLY